MPAATYLDPAGMKGRVVTDAQQFGRVAVAMGGSSAERAVSLASGECVLNALKSLGVDAVPIDGIPALLDAVRAGHFSRVFNILHGTGGEDGQAQGALDALGVPYTGSGVLGSALSFDKIRAKKLWAVGGLPTPAFREPASREDIYAAASELGFPIIVKPACEGSSVGVIRADDRSALSDALCNVDAYPGKVLVEALISGDEREGGEYTVGLLNGTALPTVKIVPRSDYFDYHAKYVSAETTYVVPGLSGSAEKEMRRLAEKAFETLGCAGWGRVDIMRDRTGKNWLLEANTAPGMTTHSLMPKSARAAGLSFAELCWRVLETSLARDQGRL